jgi:hypothetical protein
MIRVVIYIMLNSNINLIAKKDYINDNNVDANNNNSDALKVKSLLTSRKRKAFATRSIQLKSLLKTYIEASNKSITIKKNKYQYVQ